MKNMKKLILVFLMIFMVLSFGAEETNAQACVTGRIDRSVSGDPIDMLMDVHVVGNRAFTVDRWQGFHTIDVTVPVRVTGCNLPNWSFALDISGNYAYVVGSSGFYVVDITNPDAPNCAYASCLACITDNAINQKKSIHISGSFAYVTDSNDGLKVINISDPSAPFLAWSNNAAAFKHVYVSGSHAYAVDGSTLYAINTATHIVDWSVAVQASAVGISASGNYAYVSAGQLESEKGFKVIDTNTHSIIGSCSVGAGNCHDIHVVGNEVYLAGYRCTGGWCAGESIDLYRVNVANPAAPFLSGACDVTASGDTEAGYGIFVSGANAYLADGLGGFMVIGTAGLTPPCYWQDDDCGLYGCAGQMGQSCQSAGCVDSMGVCSFGETNCKDDLSCDDVDPVIDLIDAKEKDGITSISNGGDVCDTDVPARIRVDAMDNVGGTGISEITIHWRIGAGAWQSHTCNNVGSCMTPPILPLVATDNVVYWAEVFDAATPRNNANTLPNRLFDVIFCAPLCSWQNDGCGAHGCDIATQRGESCMPAGCSGGACNPAITPTQCVPDATCAPLCVWQNDGCGLYGCVGQMGQSCHPPGCIGGVGCNPSIPETNCVADPSCLENCNDIGINDEDGNGFANCADTDNCSECDPCDGIAGNRCMGGVCVPTPASEVGFCADGLNNDCQNGIDCADSDCAGDPNCCLSNCDSYGAQDPAIVCCSKNGANGICCAVGTCCSIDSQCPADTCSICALSDHYCNSSTCSCSTHNKLCPAGTHCSGNSCQPVMEICGDGIDQDCDGIDLPCCYWDDGGCGAFGCDFVTERGIKCLPDLCTGGVGCAGGEINCVLDDICRTFGLPDRTMLEILLDVADWLLNIIIALAFLMIVIGGVMYISSSGNLERTALAKKTIVYAIIGLIIAGVSYAAIRALFNMLG